MAPYKGRDLQPDAMRAPSQRTADRQPIHGTYVPARHCRCGKRGYTSRKQARTVLREVRRKGDWDISSLDIYRCRVDDTHWHLGHDSTRSKPPDLNDPATWRG